ncbi:unnamed protein product [Protopolystoma xenopodis]|uniref:Uncharacterized protein n=1 Tax=Protopolystoma xenopodis TaxID=117903 RepID=A0A3S5BDI0_9PLAT|nr:unnamed protein product [Protopolystoma xenopodis]
MIVLVPEGGQEGYLFASFSRSLPNVNRMKLAGRDKLAAQLYQVEITSFELLQRATQRVPVWRGYQVTPIENSSEKMLCCRYGLQTNAGRDDKHKFIFVSRLSKRSLCQELNGRFGDFYGVTEV